MITYKEIVIPAKRLTTLARRRCDLCEESTTEKRDWGKDHYDVEETEVRYKTGANYPEGGSGEETTIDICPKCFTEKLIPWVKSQGGEPTVKEWDW